MANEVKNVSNNKEVKMIYSSRQFEGLRSQILANKGKGSYYITELSMPKITKDYPEYRVDRSVVLQNPNREISMIPILEGYAAPTTTDGSCFRTFDRFSKAFIKIHLEDDTSLGLYNGRIFRVGDGLNEVFYQEAGRSLINLLTGDEAPNDLVLNPDGTVKDGVIVYNDDSVGGYVVTNGEIKKHDLIAPAVNLPGFDPIKNLSVVTKGMTDILFKEPYEKDYKEVAQVSTRQSAYKAASEYFHTLGAVAIFMGKFKDDLPVPGEPGNKGNEFMDGLARVDAGFMEDGVNEIFKDKYRAMPDSSCGIGLQFRPYTFKVFGKVVPRGDNWEFVKHINVPIEYIHRGTVTPELQEQFNIGVLSKGKEGMFAGKFVIISDDAFQSSRIDVLSDLNGCKAPFDLSAHDGLQILDMTHTPHHLDGGAKTSTQMIQSAMVFDPKATRAHLHWLAERFIEKKQEALFSESGHAVSWEDFQGEAVDHIQLLSQLAPAFGREYYFPIWKTISSSAIEGMMSSYNRMNIPCRGGYAKIIPDPAMDYGAQILHTLEGGETEVLLLTAEEAGEKECIGFKYPKMYFKEYLKCRVVTKGEYIDRVMKNDLLTRRQKEYIVKFVKGLTGGMIVIPAEEPLKHQEAGMDFDGDGLVYIFREYTIAVDVNGAVIGVFDRDGNELPADARDIVDILWSEQPVAVFIN